VEQELGRVGGDVRGVVIGRMTTEERLLELGSLWKLALLDPAWELAKEDPAARIVIVVDALDEVSYWAGRDSVVSWIEPPFPPGAFGLSGLAESVLGDTFYLKRRLEYRPR